MKISTIFVADQAILRGGVLRAARSLDMPASTVSDAIKRLEKTLSVQLFQSGAQGLTLTAEGTRIRPLLHEAAYAIRAIYAQCQDASERTIIESPVSLSALFRFADVMETGSIRKSARRLQIGQPQLTRMMSATEKSLGGALFARGRDGSTPSRLAVRILPHVEKLRDVWTRLSTASESRFRRHLKFWSLGGVPPATPDSPSARILAHIVANWSSRFGSQIYLQPGLANALFEGLELQRYDAILVDSPATSPRLKSHEIHRSSLSFFVRDTGAKIRDWHDEQSLIKETLLNGHLVLPSRAAGLRQVAEEVLEHVLGSNWLSRIRFTEIDSIPVSVDLVANHGYCSILPANLRVSNDDVIACPLADRFNLVLRLVWADNLRGQQMADHLQDILGFWRYGVEYGSHQQKPSQTDRG